MFCAHSGVLLFFCLVLLLGGRIGSERQVSGLWDMAKQGGNPRGYLRGILDILSACRGYRQLHNSSRVVVPTGTCLSADLARSEQKCGFLMGAFSIVLPMRTRYFRGDTGCKGVVVGRSQRECKVQVVGPTNTSALLFLELLKMATAGHLPEPPIWRLGQASVSHWGWCATRTWTPS
jgi:hypothetical protein